MLRSFIQQGHVNHRGGIAVLLLVVVWPLVGLVAMVWNTGGAVATKMRVQAAADGAALAAATWTSRTTNLVAGANRVIVRLTSAQALALAVPLTITQVTRRLRQWELVGRLMLLSVFPATVAAGEAILIDVAIERGLLAAWSVATAPATLELGAGRMASRIRNLYQFQADLIQETPRLIERQRQALETTYRCELYLTQPSQQGAERRIEPPLKRGSLAQIAEFELLVHDQVRDDRRGWERDTLLRLMVLGNAVNFWRRNTDRMSALSAGTVAGLGYFHVLATHSLAAETGNPGRSVTDQHRIRFFTVVATATPKALNRQSLMYRPIFSRRVPGPVAYAQAETYNSREAVTFSLLPWRVWTEKGWHWKPRLSYSDGLRNALRFDRDLVDFFRTGGLRLDGNIDLRSINLH